ncbi:GNAT family N-acetyltransferase [Lactobacillus sp. CC-MHH1034]|uniref:GNAT family N-acetyltransferase n=1 Tax=Agrilactobacillus fermenti TaxID=2586909 RepID=UPI001E5F63E3|nr:GNAT family N-acetyltransferase [Agrilactobacillus fermenti]MCD2255192.1 GNAT family N-acetyltransferase [Agrilactobacillus fermenti]
MSVKHTKDIHSEIYQAALKIRKAVFVVEQHVPLALEVDDNEAKAIYFVAYDQAQPVATARLLPLADKDYNLVQRVAVLADHRQQHLGATVIEALIAYQQQNFSQKALQLGAQQHAIHFYEKLGFKLMPEIPLYMDAGIPHREMRQEFS